MLRRLRRFDNKSNRFKRYFLSVPPAIRMVLGFFPAAYRHDKELKNRILKAFVLTIIPGAEEDDNNLAAMYNDDFYPFCRWSGYFVFDLCSRSRKLFGSDDFSKMTLSKRSAVVAEALKGRELTKRLFKGAILMAQVSYYGAVYNEDRGCPLISFPGTNKGYSKEETTYSFSAELFDRELTADGQPW